MIFIINDTVIVPDMHASITGIEDAVSIGAFSIGCIGNAFQTIFVSIAFSYDVAFSFITDFTDRDITNLPVFTTVCIIIVLAKVMEQVGSIVAFFDDADVIFTIGIDNV